MIRALRLFSKVRLKAANQRTDRRMIGVLPADKNEIVRSVPDHGVRYRTPLLCHLESRCRRSQRVHFHFHRSGAFIGRAPAPARTDPAYDLRRPFYWKILHAFQLPGRQCRGKHRCLWLLSATRQRERHQEPLAAVHPENRFYLFLAWPRLGGLKRNLRLALYNAGPVDDHASRFTRENVLGRLHVLDSLVRLQGLGAFDTANDLLAAIGTEVDAAGNAIKNSYGVFNLAWKAEESPEWAERIGEEIEQIRLGIRETHHTTLKNLIWAGMGGSIEDKSMYQALGALKKGPRFYALDSTDPAKLKSILADMQARGSRPLPEILRSTLVVGMAMGMTSYEPVLNLEKLSALYSKYKIDSRPNFLYLTLPGSLLDQFAAPRGYRKVELQLDGENSTAGRHSGPLTRGSLYPLALAGMDLRKWIAGTFLSEEEILTTWKLAAFLQAQAESGRDKVTLLPSKPWAGAALWTKQDFEESLGKSESTGIKIVIGEKLRPSNYYPPGDARQDRVFLVIGNEESSVLQRAGYPVAVLKLPAGCPVSRYMQVIHYAVFGLAYLRRMNFVTQPSVELYKSIANALYAEAKQAGGIENTSAWKELQANRIRWRGGVSLYGFPASRGASAPQIYAEHLAELARDRKIEYGELTFFGDTRYSPQGRHMWRTMDLAREQIFNRWLKMPADVYEGPAMNHSYHEMIIGHGRCFSTVLLSEKQQTIPAIDYRPDYHTAQFLATKLALEKKGRFVSAITVKDLGENSLSALAEFFAAVEACYHP